MIIKLYDENNQDLGLLDIWREDFERFTELLNKYREEDEYYNTEDFIVYLKENNVSVKELTIEKEVYF